MLKLRQITFVTIALIGISQIHIPIAFAEIDRSWRPQLSEKILLLPMKHMNNAIEKDFSTYNIYIYICLFISFLMSCF